MFLSYICTVDDFDSFFFFEKEYDSCLIFKIYSLLLEEDKKQIEVVAKI